MNPACRLSLVVVLAAASGCVWNPSDQSNQSRFASVPINGMAQLPGSQIRVFAFNHETGLDEEVLTTTSSNSPLFGPPELYSWDTGWTVFAQKFWYPPAWGCSSGMLRLRVTEDGGTLATFDEAQRDCVLTEMSNGDHPVNGAMDCGYQDQIVIFAPTDC